MPELNPEPSNLIGKTIGPYRIEAVIGPSRWGTVFRAFQSSVHRAVVLKIVSPEVTALPGRTELFLDESRAAAQIAHPHIVAIYEAGQKDGVHYCAMEYLDGPPLEQFLRAGDAVDEHHLLQTVASVARAMDFLWQRQIPHQPLLPRNILTDSTGTVKLINIAPVGAATSESPTADMQSLGVLVATIANEAGVRPTVGEFVERMAGSPDRKPFGSLADLADSAEALDRQLFPPPPPPESTIEKIKPKKTRPIVLIALSACLLVVIGLIVKLALTSSKPPPAGPARPADFGKMVEVVAGEFIYQDGEKQTLPAFFIDKYEVTIGEYKVFLDSIATNETALPGYQHLKSIKTKPEHHQPGDWENMQAAIEQNQLSWDTPVFNIDWFDAYAYAAWARKRLPTEVEWEKAARGTNGVAYPWGDKFDPAKCDCATESKPGKLGAAVYAYPGDKSPFSVIGMAGNVSEWTTTVPVLPPALPVTTGKKGKSAQPIAPPAPIISPVVCGGSWADTDPRLTLRRPTPRAGDTRAPTIGFRCVSDKDIKP